MDHQFYAFALATIMLLAAAAGLIQIRMRAKADRAKRRSNHTIDMSRSRIPTDGGEEH